MRLKSTRVYLIVILAVLMLACQLTAPMSQSSPIASPVMDESESAPEPEPEGEATPEAGSGLPGPVRWLLPVMTGAGGGLIILLLGFVALVALLWLQVRRRRADLGPPPSSPQDTARVSAASPNPAASLSPLPEGTLLSHGRFRVRAFEQQAGDLNVYVARGTQEVRVCPQCHAPTEHAERFCANCGIDVTGIEPTYLDFVVKESASADAFAALAGPVEAGFTHPGVLLPRAIFAEGVGGTPRYYQVTRDYRPYQATQLSAPPPSINVLRWGASMARGMAALHGQNLALRAVDLHHLLIENGVGRCLCQEQAQALEGVSPEQAQLARDRDVQALAASLQQIAAGSDLLLELAALLSQAQEGVAGMSAEVFASRLERMARALRRPEQVSWRVGQCTDVGQERAVNEDNLLAIDNPPALRYLGQPVGFYAVADGMGGHSAGDVASRVTVETLTQLAREHQAEEIGAAQWLERAARAANQEVLRQREDARSNMGCTLVLALCVADAVSIANVGDSRAYHLTSQRIQQITVDHSLVERLVAMGQITLEEARTHPQKSVIYRVIGDRPQLEVDHFQVLVAPGEAVLLCSDGLSGMIEDEEIWQLWQTAPSPQVACEQMVAAANAAGGRDNITVIIVQMVEGT